MRALAVAFGLAASMAAGPPAAAATTFQAVLDGPSSAVPNASPGTGFATFDDVGHSLFVKTEFSGLLGAVTAAHIHAPTIDPGTGTAAAAILFPGFPTAVTSGVYAVAFDLTLPSTYGAAFLNASGGTAALAEERLLAAMRNGQAYFNIHTDLFPAEEIRGFLTASPTPEPTSWALMIGGFGLAGAALRRRRTALA